MEGGRVEIAKLWEPRQCAEDEGREGGEEGGGKEKEGERARGTTA